jgi:hypothetical protein
MIYGLAGGMLGKTEWFAYGDLDRSRLMKEGLKFGAIGFLLTFVYDLLTNIATSYSLGLPLVPVLVAGIPFGMLHEISNAAFFFLVVTPVMNLIRRLPEGDHS